MTDKDKYLFIEFVLTFGLIFLAVSLFWGVIPVFCSYIILAVLTGFIFSWLIRSLSPSWMRYILSLGTVAIFSWLAYSIMTSSFVYGEVILLSIKGLLILIIMICFYLCDLNYLNYAQMLTIPLFVTAFLVLKTRDDPVVVMSIAGYCLIWPLLFKVKFYRRFQKKLSWQDLKLGNSMLSLGIIFFLGCIIAAGFCFIFPLQRITTGGIFILEGAESMMTESRLEDEYYSLQGKLLKELPDQIPYLEQLEKKQELLLMLNKLIEGVSTIQEVDQAEEGLESYFKNPGPGLEESQTPGEKPVEVLLKDYVDKKIKMNQNQIKEETSNMLRDPFLIQERFGISSQMQQAKQAKSKEELDAKAKELGKILKDSSSLSKPLKDKLWENIKAFLKWQALQIKRNTPREKLSANIPIPEMEPDKAKENIKTKIPEQITEKEKKILPSKPVRAGGGSFPGALMVAAVLLFFIPIFLWLVLYLFLEQKREKIAHLYKTNKRDFILQVYDNLKEVLAVFGQKHYSYILPRDFARLSEKRFSIKDGLLFGLTEKFEETKYSSHEIKEEELKKYIQDYDGVISSICKSSNNFKLFINYLSLLIKRRPLFLLKA